MVENADHMNYCWLLLLPRMIMLSPTCVAIWWMYKGSGLIQDFPVSLRRKTTK